MSIIPFPVSSWQLLALSPFPLLGIFLSFEVGVATRNIRLTVLNSPSHEPRPGPGPRPSLLFGIEVLVPLVILSPLAYRLWYLSFF